MALASGLSAFSMTTHATLVASPAPLPAWTWPARMPRNVTAATAELGQATTTVTKGLESLARLTVRPDLTLSHPDLMLLDSSFGFV